MDTYFPIYSLIAGIILNPVMILLKHFVFPKNEEEEISNTLMSLTAAFLGIIFAALINYLGHYSIPAIDIILVGLGIKGTSALTNIPIKATINKLTKSPQ